MFFTGILQAPRKGSARFFEKWRGVDLAKSRDFLDGSHRERESVVGVIQGPRQRRRGNPSRLCKTAGRQPCFGDYVADIGQRGCFKVHQEPRQS